MGETFRAEPAEIAGFGNFVGENYADFGRARDLLNTANASSGFEGLLGIVSGPINELHFSTHHRWGTISTNLATMSTGLRKTAWLFSQTDQENADALRAHTHSVDRGPGENGPHIEVDPSNSRKKLVVEDYPDPVSYGTPTPIDVTEPPKGEADVRELVREKAGWLADIDAKVETYAGWSPVKHALEPLVGNWEELRRIGATYGTSGTAIGTIGNDVTDGTAKLEPSWDGLSAQAFAEYAQNTANYIEWEAALGRMLQEGLDKAATQFEESVQAVVNAIVEEFARFVDLGEKKGVVKALAKAIPGVGVIAWADTLISLLKAIGDVILPAVQDIENAIEDLRAFIEFAQDPVGYLQERGEAEVAAQLEPYKHQVAEIDRRRQIGQDVITLARTEHLTDREESGYRVEEGESAWQDGR